MYSLVELVDSLTRNNDCKILIYAKDKEKCLNLNFELKRQLDLDVLDFRKEEHRKHFEWSKLRFEQTSYAFFFCLSFCEHSERDNDHI